VLAGIYCADDTTVASMAVTRGFWRASFKTKQTYPCEKRDGGRWTPCLGSRNTSQRRQLAENEQGMLCAEGYGGPKCEMCLEDQYYFAERDAKCHKCGEVWRTLGWVLTAIAAATTLTAAMLAIALRMGWLAYASIWAAMHRARANWTQAGMQPKLKLIISFYQVVASVPSVYVVSLPDGRLSAWVKVLEWPSILLTDIIAPATCTRGGYFTLLLVSSFYPWALILLLTALHALCTHAKTVRCAFVRGRVLILALPPTLIVTFCAVTSSSARIFNTLLLDRFKYDDAEDVYIAYLHDDYSFGVATLGEARSSKYAQVRNWALGLIALWPAGVPLLYMALLAKSAHAIRRHEPAQLSRALHFLFADYRLAYFFWEPVELMRRLALTGFVLLVGEEHELLRALIALLVSFFWLVAQWALKPYKQLVDNHLAAVANIALTLIFLGVLLLKTCKVSPEVCEQFGVGGSGDGIFLLILIFSMVVVLGFVAFSLRQLLHSSLRNATVLLLRATGAPPVLPLARGIKYHLFLSHVWSSGQDQVAVIKRQLQICLPGVHIFLDVDDLVDIGNLEAYIAQSAAVLLFLSKGYFHSLNCLREARAAMANDMLLVLIHEADPQKGGLPMADIRDQCPADLAAFVFAERQALPWQRVSEYQRLALKLIAEHVLGACPVSNYADPLEVECRSQGLYFKGEVACADLAFARPVTLLVSDHNPGAAELAAELRAALLQATL